MAILKFGAQGAEVTALQQSLKQHNFDPGLVDDDFGPATEAAVIAFQSSDGLLPDGIVGLATSTALGLPPAPALADITGRVTVEMVSRMFPGTPVRAITANLPFVLTALHEQGLGDKSLVLMALSTIRAEVASFEPIAEGISRFNTSPNGHAFDLYDYRKDLGNLGSPDGARFRGRGFVQLTGRANYTTYSSRLDIGTGLVDDPNNASNKIIAANLLALFLKDKERRIREALLEQDLAAARKLVNGGSHGLNDFTDAYRAGGQTISDEG